MQYPHGKVLLAPEVAKQEREVADLYSNIKVRLSEHLELPQTSISSKTHCTASQVFTVNAREHFGETVSAYTAL